jgi:TRAP-type transport system periplasmic protein
MKRLAIALACTVAAGAVQAQWKLATGYRAESFQGQNIMQFARDVEASTGGQLRIEVHPNNALVKLAEIPKAVRDGKVEAGETILTNMAKDIPIAGADTVPFVVTSYADAQRLWQLQRPILEQQMEQRGLKLLYAVPWPPQGLYSTRPIQKPSDLVGTRMRTYNQTTVRIAEMLEAKSVDVPMVEVSKALAAGLVDNMITSAVTGVENQVWTHLKHYYEINAWFPKNAVFVNAQAFKALKPGVQQAVLASARIAETRGWAMSQAAMHETTEALRLNGMKVEKLPADFMRDLKRVGERFSREWIQTVGADANKVFIPYYTY